MVTRFGVPNIPDNTITQGITAGPDGALWFVEEIHSSGNVTGAIGRVTTGGVFAQYVKSGSAYVPGGSFGNGGNIALGSDGGLWFAEIDYADKSGKIGRIQP